MSCYVRLCKAELVSKSLKEKNRHKLPCLCLYQQNKWLLLWLFKTLKPVKAIHWAICWLQSCFPIVVKLFCILAQLNNLRRRNKVLLRKLSSLDLLRHSPQTRGRPLTFVCFHYVNWVSIYWETANRKVIIFSWWS